MQGVSIEICILLTCPDSGKGAQYLNASGIRLIGVVTSSYLSSFVELIVRGVTRAWTPYM